MSSTAEPFAATRLDRADQLRGDERWVAERRREPAARALAVTPDGVYMAGAAPSLFALPELRGEPLLLGLREPGGEPLFAVEVADAPDGRPVGLREALTITSRADAGLVAYAAALAGWHRRHRFCSACGARSETREAGHVRVCPRCAAVHHPRTDPVVIVLVHDGERVLLGRQPAWPAGRYSALAGFVEPGETLEQAVAREVREEARVEVGEPRYRASQPWPFPASQMLAFTAGYAGGDAAVGDGELDDVGWFTRGDLRAAAAERGPLRLPPPAAIARLLIDEWIAESLS